VPFAQKLLETQQRLKQIAADHTSVAFANSLGTEDMVLMDIITKYAPSIEIFSIDTGRLPPETYDLIERAIKHYRRKIKVYFPEQSAVENFVRINGINGFRDSVAQRLDCCHARKVEPLKRALRGKSAWITGQRRAQAVTRKNLSVSEFDAANGLQKYNPLIEWGEDDVWDYINEFAVPYNVLHDQGYPSIGCAPCTRAIEPGEDIRAGRWWWENAEQKECGLHLKESAENPAVTVSS
jgi:phosphoadenosine phosphosulfate reductase